AERPPIGHGAAAVEEHDHLVVVVAVHRDRVAGGELGVLREEPTLAPGQELPPAPQPLRLPPGLAGCGRLPGLVGPLDVVEHEVAGAVVHRVLPVVVDVARPLRSTVRYSSATSSGRCGPSGRYQRTLTQIASRRNRYTASAGTSARSAPLRMPVSSTPTQSRSDSSTESCRNAKRGYCTSRLYSLSITATAARSVASAPKAAWTSSRSASTGSAAAAMTRRYCASMRSRKSRSSASIIDSFESK